MARLIDAEKLKKEFTDAFYTKDTIHLMIDAQPTVKRQRRPNQEIYTKEDVKSIVGNALRLYRLEITKDLSNILKILEGDEDGQDS